MRVLFVTFPWRTHFQLNVTMAWALHTAGHEVRCASGPELTDVITGSGLTAVPVGSDETVQEKLARAQKEGRLPTPEQLQEMAPIDMAEERPEMLTWERLTFLSGIVAGNGRILNDSMVDDLVDYCRWWKPDLVVWEASSYAGSLAATAAGVPHARMPLALDADALMRRNFLRLRAQQNPADQEDPVRDWLTEWAEKYGFPFSEELVTGQFSIDQMPESMLVEREVPHVGFRYVPYNGRAVVPGWIRAEPPAPRVLATFGVSMQDMPELQALSVEQLQETLDLCADLEMELVLTLPNDIRNELERIPENTTVVEFVPLSVIIPSCSAVIHHGGVPAFSGALTHGIPQLMISRIAPDAAPRGRALEEARAGLWLPPEETTAADIREKLVQLLEDPSFRSGAERLQREMLAQPSPNDAVREVERLAATRGSH
ncbi:activator-dependent family glycosyltransferase [Streptomyces oceani]|uniref:Uncharacterized protein n=1 Tax=Streptomyces oceani TaxID=1075402 RepID=A0A1E7KFD6_9ACTN|nr:activator-dependent family glycosyltransferase [Streptomyces oceani]OEV02639.1 hypothetical protein AN216_14120 [Streptomyces oceani]